MDRPDLIAMDLNSETLWNGLLKLRSQEGRLKAHFIAYLSEIDKRKLWATVVNSKRSLKRPWIY